MYSGHREDREVVAQIVGNLPTAGAVTATASIAVVATSSAIFAKPLADLLLRVVKPVVKKALTKVQTLLGRKLQRCLLLRLLQISIKREEGFATLEDCKEEEGIECLCCGMVLTFCTTTSAQMA